MLAQTPCREFANRWEPKDYFIISAIGLLAADLGRKGSHDINGICATMFETRRFLTFQ